MVSHDVFVIGASAGGVEALSLLVRTVPENFPGAIFIVLHVPSQGTSVLPNILTRAGKLPALHPKHGQPIEVGKIYVAPPDFHLLLKDGHIHLIRGPQENGHRPAIDPLFRSAARTYGRRVVGVVLSGVLDDGTAGLLAVKTRGGIAIVQDPDEAMYSGMPRSALENVDVDHILPVTQMGELFMQLVLDPVEDEEGAVPEEMKIETDLTEMDKTLLHNEHRAGKPATLACPTCGGTLWEVDEEDLIRFRCRVGHGFSAQSLLAEQNDALEDAFWAALRALEESASLAQRLSERAQQRGQPRSAEHFRERAEAARERATLVRSVLLNGATAPSSVSTDDDTGMSSDRAENAS
jgi:two-component system, chemotaxis family, protein-glutamate methylesterase/glutaminase